ncbi:DUF4982 domain-containing protein [Seonamhaeicola sp. MEBiC1930]|uniref:glycoside hydrolase family 2 TIM barrel-domain containing protein n=1 Tax=Seonamhaeicola sp. MEBiC01930 TaxID=2976768 RepID=UPI003254C448
MKNLTYIIIFSICFLMLACNKKESTYAEKLNFNKDWVFKLLDSTETDNSYFQEEINIETWEDVILPHTPRLEPKIVNDQWQGVCWYRKSFVLPSEMKGKKLYLNFEGAMNIAEVWVNGEKKIKHHGGYLPFVVDFSNEAIWDGENVVAVRLDNRDNPTTGPKPLKTLDFNTFGGIYRNVWLVAKAPLHITDPILAHRKASGGVFVSYPEVSKEKAIVKVQTHVHNENDRIEEFSIKNTLYKNGKTIISKQDDDYSLGIDENIEFTTEFIVEKPELWSPQYPNLYILETEIVIDGQTIDKELTTIGIKTMKFVGQDFYLNGEKTFLRGVNRHQEYPYIGYALSDKANYRDAKKIKDAGFDYVRLSHYPHSTAFMDACDELGIMTIDAILGWQYFSEDEKFQNHVFQTAKDLIRRDRNHASVLAWEVSLNESWMPETFIDCLHTIAHEEYPGDQCFSAGWQAYGYDIYLQARQHRLQHYDVTLKKPYNVSEYGDWEYYAMNAGFDQNSWNDLLQEDRSSRQLRNAGEIPLLQQASNIQEAHNDNLNTPAFADGYWVMFDYNRGYANDLEASGIMDIFRLSKPAYYFFKSQRDADDPFGESMVYIASNWQKDSPLDVRVFSNCDEVELFLNGKSLGKQKPDQDRMSNNLKHPPFTFDLSEFIPGEIEARAFKDGKLVAYDNRHTPKDATDIEVKVDLEGYEIGNNDVVFVHALIKDLNGTVIPDFSGKVSFNVEGNGELLGENPVAFEAGIASVILKTGQDIKELKISAEVIGLNLSTSLIMNKY